jgi:hypothetical protein
MLAGISAIAEVVDAWDVSPLSPQLAGALVEVLPQLVQVSTAGMYYSTNCTPAQALHYVTRYR